MSNLPAAKLAELLAEAPAAAAERARATVAAQTNGIKHYALYGAGQLGRSVLARLRAGGLEPVAFADDTPEKQGKVIDGLPVMRPGEVVTSYGDSVAFVVTILNPFLNFVEARRRLQQTTNARVISFLLLAWKHADAFLPYLQFELPQQVLSKATDIQRGFALLADQESQRQFVAHLQFRLYLDYEALPNNSHDDYFPPDLMPRLPDNAVFIDCGAYDGDTLRRFLDHQQRKFQSVYAFEPDAQNYARLCEYVSSLGPDADRIHAFKAGVGARRERLRFNAAGNMASSFGEGGATEVDVVPLDEIVDVNGAPTLLKFDVEGAEWESLKGCQRLLERVRPKIAISAYHRPDDLWALPLYLDSLGLGYRFFLRTQGEDGMDAICYAIPE